MTTFPCIESLLEINTYDCLVRLWVNKPELVDGKGKERLEKSYRVREIFDNEPKISLNEIIDKVRSIFPDLNAIQISEKTPFDGIRLGTVIYITDFSTNEVHG